MSFVATARLFQLHPFNTAAFFDRCCKLVSITTQLKEDQNMQELSTDYLVVGSGAMGMAFADACLLYTSDAADE